MTIETTTSSISRPTSQPSGGVDRGGPTLRKDRGRNWLIHHQGGFNLVDLDGRVIAGADFNLSLEDVERWLTET